MEKESLPIEKEKDILLPTPSPVTFFILPKHFSDESTSKNTTH